MNDDKQRLIVARERTYTIPVNLDHDVYVRAVFPMMPDQWDCFMTVLQAMKPGIVKE